MNKPTVFISYSHKDEAWKNLLRPHLGVLEKTDQIVIWDDRQIDAGDEWYQQIKATMECAAVTVCLISADYLASDFCQKEEIPFLLNRRKDDGMLLIPLLVRPCLWKAVPWLRQLQMLPRDGKSIAKDFKDDPDEVFTSVAETTYDFISQLQPVAEPVATKSTTTNQIIGDRNIITNGNVFQSSLVSGDFNTLLQAPSPPNWSALPDEKFYLERLPVTGTTLFGRDEQLNLLDEVWEKNDTNVLSFIAWGGVGKSTLVNKWLEQMRTDNYRGAQRVYAWSFYSQGTTERATSADLFIAEALKWFGDDAPNAGSPWDKGERLANLIRSERTLLILDGVEPLQSAHAHERGKLKDPALLTLLEALAHDNPGLCLISTRERLTDLDALAGSHRFSTASKSDRLSVQQIDLEKLSPASARALLRASGVRGSDAELEAGAATFGCHALALNLLAEYLRDISGHPIAEAANIPALELPPDQQKDEAPRRMIDALANKLNTGTELNVLRMLGLFDRPAEKDSLDALRKKPVIAGLTDQIGARQEANWLRAVQRLRQYKLLAEVSHHAPNELDAHPLVREHFADQLQRTQPAAWQAGNLRLYEHLTRTAKEFPDTMEEMAPLYAAMVHGCAAGLQKQVLDNVYVRRILREFEYFSINKLGAFSTDLAALIEFFDSPRRELSATLTADDQAWLLNQAGVYLIAIGHLREAVQMLEMGLGVRVTQKNWLSAAITAENLSELTLKLGNITDSLAIAEQGIKYAADSNDWSQLSDSRTVLAYMLYQAGRLPDAVTEFHAAEALKQEWDTEFRLLCSLPGFRYCDLLLNEGQFHEVQSRATQTLEYGQSWYSSLTIALDQLALGRAHLGLAQQAGVPASHLVQAADWLHYAVDGLRQSGQQDELPRGLLARAAWARVAGQFDRAYRDLIEAFTIAERGEMRLHLADCHLEYARLALARADKDRAREHYDIAKKMIAEMGYHRRDKEVDEIAAQLDC